MSKKVYLKDSREKLLEGINLYTDAVKSTLGPSGKCVIIDNANGEDPFSTKDGVTVGNSIDHSDPVMNTGIQMVKKVSSKTDFDNGDGTTTATVWCRELISLGMELQKLPEYDEHLFKKTIQNELAELIKKLRERAIKLPIEEIYKIALTSANNDVEIAELFQVAFNNATEKGYINIVDSVTGQSYVDIVKGFVVDLGMMDSRFANVKETGFFEANLAKVVLYDNEFTDRKQMVKLIQDVQKSNNPVVIVAKNFSKEVIQIVDYNNAQPTNKICLMKNELRNEEYLSFLEDLSVYTGADIITQFDEFDVCYGEANNIVVKQGYAILGESAGTRKEIANSYFDALHEKAENEKSQAVKTAILKRVDKMKNGVTTFYVGGNSEIEIREKRDRVQDAYRACKLALSGKVIIGGGQSLVLLSKNMNYTNDYQALFCKVIRQPFIEILKNSLHTTDAIDVIKENITFKKGYNAKTRKYENLYNTGVLDPVEVIINGLKNAVSIGMTILSTECLIVES